MGVFRRVGSVLVLAAVAACGRPGEVRGHYVESARVTPRPDDWSKLQPGTGWVLYVSQLTKAALGIGEATQTSVIVELASVPALGDRVDVSAGGARARCERGNLGARALAARGSFVLSARTGASYQAEIDLTCVDSTGAAVWAARRSLSLSPMRPF